jgi:hypothetical protein
MSALLQIAVAAETRLPERPTLKLLLTARALGTLTVSKMDEKQMLPLKTLMRKRASRCLLLGCSVNKFDVSKIT